MEEKGYPADDRYYVLKQDESLGPFDVEELLEQIEIGAFSYDDVCLRVGDTGCSRLRDILDWDDATQLESVEASHEANQWDQRDSPDEEDQDGLEEAPPATSPKPGTVLYCGHPSMLSQPLPFLGLLGGIVAAIWLYPIDLKFTFGASAVAIFSLTSLSFTRFTNEYFVTGRRIEVVKGLIARSSNEVRISDVRAINVTCSGLIGAMGVGTVDFFTAGDEPEVTFRKVWAAKKVKSLVRRLQDSPV